MIQPGNQKERHTLPRWNSTNTSKRLGELTPTKLNDTIITESSTLDGLLLEWNVEKNLPLAIDIISEAKLTSSPRDISEIIAYAQNVANKIREDNPLLNEFLFGVDESVDISSSHQRSVARLKKSLALYPRNPLLWSELSREYTILGQKKKSERAIHTALDLAPDNRIILRAIARFYAHNGDIEHALYFLRNSTRLKEDPWLLSSEIALSNESGKTSKNIKLGQKMITDKKYYPLSLSELASELGTMDFLSGSSKQGKKKIEIATQIPHENAIAQIAWINKNAYNLSAIMSSIPETDYNFEAETRMQFDAQKWTEALQSSRQWQEYQPFSREPAMVGSFIASDYLMDYKSAESMLHLGIDSNPTDYRLLNNYAYILALTDRLEEANESLTIARRFSPVDYIPIVATTGLVCYRQGNITDGRLLYSRAIEMSKRSNDLDLFYRATLCLAREEHKVGNPISEIMDTINAPKYAGLQKHYEQIARNFDLESI